MKSDRARFNWIPLVVVALALVLRLLHDAEMARTPFFRYPGLDAQWHHEWGTAIAGGAESREPYFRAPGYAWFLAAVYRVAGPGPWASRVVQALLGALTVYLVYRVGRRLFGRSTGGIAAAMAALYGPLIYFDGELLAPTLALPLFFLALHLSLRAAAGRSWWPAGLAFGAGAVVLPNILAVVTLLGLAMALRNLRPAEREVSRHRGRRPEDRRPLSKTLAPLVLGTAVMLAPVVIRNGVVGGDWALASQGGVNFFAGNNARATGVSVVLPQFERQPGWREFVARTEAYAREATGRALRPSQVSSFYTAEGLRWWASDPIGALRLMGAKIYYLLNGHEIPNNRDLNVERRYSRILAALVWHLGPLHFPFGFVLPLAVYGLLVARGRGAWILILYLAGYGLSVVLFFVSERYRLPLVPALIVFAAAGLRNLPRASRAGWKTAAAVALSLVVANSHLGHAGVSNPGQEVMRLGEAWLEAGDYPRSVEAFREATAIDAGSPDPQGRLGAALELAGHKADALRAYEEAVKRRSSDHLVYFNRASLLLEAGRVPEAVASLERAVQLDDAYTAAWVNLGLALSATGRSEKALQALDRALAIEPSNATALVEKGRLLASRGDRGGARQAWEAAARLAPDQPEARLNLAILAYDEGDPAAAARLLDDILERNPNLAPAHFQAARVAAGAGNREKMMTHLRRAAAGGFIPAGGRNDPAFARYASDPEVQGMLH